MSVVLTATCVAPKWPKEKINAALRDLSWGLLWDMVVFLQLLVGQMLETLSVTV